MSTLAVNTITNAAGGNTAQINGMTPTADSLQGFRNRIINGDMRIDQRNAGASISTGYCVDRFTNFQTYTSNFTFQRNGGSVTPPAGFTNYLGVTVGTGRTVAAGDAGILFHAIEGFNVADFAYGTSGAIASTLSFWVRSSLTGTHGGTIKNSANNRSYPFSFSISAANTWEYKTIVIPGDTTGTWLTDNGKGIVVCWSLGSGSTYTGTANSWQGSDLYGVNGQVNLCATSGATFYITGVQLEAGSVATPFERRPYGTELALCQRYYETTGMILLTAVVGHYQPGYWAVQKRAAPTLTLVPLSGTSGAVANFSQDTTKGFYQSNPHSGDINARVIGSIEL